MSLNKQNKVKYFKAMFSVIKDTAFAVKQIKGDMASKVKYEAEQDYTSVFTEADALADKMIYEGLTQITPSLPVISEENFVGEMARLNIDNLTDTLYWCYDPIDGSSHEKERNGRSGSLVSLIDNGRPIISLVYRIHQDMGYFAIKGLGAYKFHDADYNNRKRIHTSPNNLEEGITVRYEGQHMPDHSVMSGLYDVEVKNCQQLFNDRIVYEQAEKERKERGQPYSACGNYELGAYLQCQVAEGNLDFLPFLMNKCAAGEWDIVSSDLILEEAGGYLTDLNGDTIIYGHPDQKAPNYAAYNNKDIFERFRENLFDAYELNDEGVFVLKNDPIPKDHAFAL